MRWVLVVLVSLVFVGSPLVAFGHTGGMAGDGCHNHRAEGNRHFHVEGTSEIAGLCEENEHGETVKVPFKPVCPVCPTCPEPEVIVREVKDVNVMEFEAAMSRVTERLTERMSHAVSAAQNCPTKVVEVKVPADAIKPTTEQCVDFRQRFHANYNAWGGKKAAADIANNAIKAGCF